MKNRSNNKFSDRIISNFLENPSDRNMGDLVSYSTSNDFGNEKILELAIGLSKSETTIKVDTQTDIFDVPSTGGPGSLSTLLCPLFLRVFDKHILKLGVPGRPAGGIDVLSQIEGFNINPSNQQLKNWYRKCKYVHFQARDEFTPLDARLFIFRKQKNKVGIPQLVIASILSKKIAVGVNRIGLDIRVSSFGNFGRTWDNARENGILFKRVANLLGMRCECFLTNCDIPQQPYIGRGESILALYKIFRNEIDDLLRKHVALCNSIASALVENHSIISPDSLLSPFLDNLQIQGGSLEAFENKTKEVENHHQFYICSDKSGFLWINMKKMRDAIISIQSKCPGNYPDPCGVILRASANEYVSDGDVVCTFRCVEEFHDEFEKSLSMVFEFRSERILFEEYEQIE